MSLILDALRKSEHGRHGASDSVLPLIVTPRAGKVRKKRVAYLPILIMLLVVIATAVIFIYRERIFPPRIVTQKPAAPALAKPQQLAQQGQQQLQRQNRMQEPVKKVQRAAIPEAEPAPSIVEVKSEKPPVSRSVAADRPKVVKRSMPVKEGAATPPEPGSKPGPGSVKQDAIPAALSTLPADFIRKVQPLHLDFHVYSSDVSRRMVYINNREYEEGDRLKNNLTILRIVPQGAVMQWNQKSFLLTAQD